jgi:hypothetical protein
LSFLFPRREANKHSGMRGLYVCRDFNWSGNRSTQHACTQPFYYETKKTSADFSKCYIAAVEKKCLPGDIYLFSPAACLTVHCHVASEEGLILFLWFQWMLFNKRLKLIMETKWKCLGRHKHEAWSTVFLWSGGSSKRQTVTQYELNS